MFQLNKFKYKKILSLKKKFKFSNFELITNYGLFSGDTNLFKTLMIFKFKNIQIIDKDATKLFPGFFKKNTV